MRWVTVLLRQCAQPHQGDPAQATGLDHLRPTGAHPVAVDAQGFNFRAAAPFQGFVDSENQRTIALVQMLEQQHEQDACRLAGRPHRPIEHLMITGVVAVVAESHDPERRCHGALAGSQYRADQQDLGFQPGRVAKQRGEGMEYGYHRVGQGEHCLAFFQEGPASLPCSYNLSSFCAKSRQG